MSSKPTLPVVLKKEPQKIIGLRWLVLSRIASTKIRKDLDVGDKWLCEIDTFDQIKAESQYAIFKAHGAYREYMLVQVSDELNDEIPFGKEESK